MGRILSWAVSLASVAVLCAACAGILVREPGERLFFALEIDDGGRVVGRPQVIGETGKLLTIKLVEPGSVGRPRLSMKLVPEHEGGGYRVQLELDLPDRPVPGKGVLAIEHAEERRVEIGNPVRPLSVKLMVMRVASPEFEAWVKLARKPPAAS